MKKKYCRPKIEDIDVVKGEEAHGCSSGLSASDECWAGGSVHLGYGCEFGDYAYDNCNNGGHIAVLPSCVAGEGGA